MKGTRMNLVSLMLVSGLAATAITGCARDRTVDEWRRSQVDQEVSQIKAVEGVYGGSLTRERAGALGQIELWLEADTRVSDSKDRPGAEQQAVIRGRIQIVTDALRVLSFENGSFDSSTGSFKATAPVTDRAGSPTTLKITGVVQGDRISGRLEAERFADAGLAFRLVRGVRADLGRISKDGKPSSPSTSDAVKRYAGTATWANGRESHDVDLQLVTRWAGSDQDFLEILLPVKTVDATVLVYFKGRPQNESDRESGRHEPDSALFPNSSIDSRIGTLVGRTSGAASGTDRYTLTLKCIEARHPGSSLPGWDCEYVSNLYGALFHMSVDPVEVKP